MGKDLKGKELGVGITQLQDGTYLARYTNKDGTRHGKRFDSWAESKQWIADIRFKDEHCNIMFPEEIILDEWFKHWIDQIQRRIKKSTLKTYKDIYNHNISKVIGHMELRNIKPIHCQKVLNEMADAGKKTGTISNTKRVLYSILETAYHNDIITDNPCRKGVTGNIGIKGTPKEAMTVDEQQIFLKGAKKTAYYDEYVFILQTGIRIGELTGLQWKDIDFNNKTIHIQRTTGWNSAEQKWITTAPKSETSNRIIPLTEEAVAILKQQKIKRSMIKIIPFEWSDNVFLNANGKPRHAGSYNKVLNILCNDLGIRHISVHILRHTFATRCIEGNMKPKTLQKIMGHANIRTTMDLYVHTTEEEKQKEIKLVENLLKIC